ncbi:MAG: carboxypeptidase-like regulatory domain-containing protein, partial [Bacteroidales bacterium]|nr:carboxypeptidase-like regulatory domain-containing protein [Bacteroidales bacterium]
MKNKPIILILIIFLFCQAAVLSQGKGSILDKKIQLNNQITTLEQALKIIGREGDFTFSYGNKIPVGQEVVLKAGEYTVKEMLDVILRDIPVDYIVKKDKILLIPRKENTGLTQTVRGRIIDRDSGLPIPGVNVFIASPMKGTVTDLEGNFRLKEIPVGRHELEISCMGYEGKSLPSLVVHSGKETFLQFELEESILDIGEVTIRHK